MQAEKITPNIEASPTQDIHRQCPQCDADATNSPVLPESQAEWELTSCPACEFVFLRNPVTYEALSEDFAWEKQFDKERETRRKKRRLGAWISENTRWRTKLLPRKDMQAMVAHYAPKGKIVDIGCGAGNRLMRLPKDYTPYGIEISKALAARAREQLVTRGGDCIHAPALEALRQCEAGFFAGASLRSYLEHEVEAKPVLHALHHALQPGGMGVIKVPNYDCLNRKLMGDKWAGYRFPDHVNYFTPSSLRTMVENAGFKVKRFRWYDHMPTSDNMWMVIERL
jgi:SAM-dependent methyltransferase